MCDGGDGALGGRGSWGCGLGQLRCVVGRSHTAVCDRDERDDGWRVALLRTRRREHTHAAGRERLRAERRSRRSSRRGCSRRAPPETTPGSTRLPSSTDGCVFIGSFGGVAYALDAKTGHVVWQRKLEAPKPGSGGAIVGAAAIDGRVGGLPRRRVRRSLRDRAQPLDRRGDLEERTVRAAAERAASRRKAPTRTRVRSWPTAS